MADLVTCKYCGVVERGHRCPYRPRAKTKETTEQRRFRNSQAWIKKSAEVKQKAKYLCEVCLEGTYNTINLLTYKDLETHHIEPIGENFDKRLDNDNLIVLCQQHHKMAEKGDIPKDYLQKLAQKRETK